MSLDQNQGLDCPSQERHEDTPPKIPVLFLSIIPSVKPTQLIPKFNQFSSPRKCFLGDSFPVSIISAEGLLSGPCLILTSVYTYEIRELSLLYTFSYYSFINFLFRNVLWNGCSTVSCVGMLRCSGDDGGDVSDLSCEVTSWAGRGARQTGAWTRAGETRPDPTTVVTLNPSERRYIWRYSLWDMLEHSDRLYSGPHPPTFQMNSQRRESRWAPGSWPALDLFAFKYLEYFPPREGKIFSTRAEIFYLVS